MKFRFSIFIKLLLIILPPVCLPIATVGYFSFQASVDRVDRLVRHEQKVQVEAIAKEINDMFFYSQLDLSLIANLPILEDYINSRAFKLKAATEFNRSALLRLFDNFIERSGHYHQIRLIDHLGKELIKRQRDISDLELIDQKYASFFQKARETGRDDYYVSPIVYTPTSNGHVIHLAKAVYSGLGEFDGVVVIDFDFDLIDQMVKGIRMGSRGYAFLIDELGLPLSHPNYKAYSRHPDMYGNSSFNHLVQQIMERKSDWAQYTFEGEEKGAAFATIPFTQWTIAITIPIVEFKKEAFAIRERVIKAVGIILFSAVIGVSILSYYLLKPVRAMVEATKRIAGGDLHHEIPIQSRDELGDLTSAFNSMVKTLAETQNELIRSEKLISMGRLSAGVAHEVRNPLHAMKGAIKYLQRRRGGDQLVVEYTQLVSEEIDRLSKFVSDFLYFAKELSPKPALTNINRLIASIQNLHREQTENSSIRFHNNLSPDIPLSFIDPGQMTQVLINILINAMDAMPEGGDITVSSLLLKSEKGSKCPDRIQVTVEDNGIGIAPDHLKNIFDPFFSTKDNGTGLGLPISIGIVENHGGQMVVNSQETHGTSVRIDWPIRARFPEDSKD